MPCVSHNWAPAQTPPHVHTQRGGGRGLVASVDTVCLPDAVSSVVQVSTVIWGGFPLSFSLTVASFHLSASVPQVRGAPGQSSQEL